MKQKLFTIFFLLVLLPTIAFAYSNYVRTAELAYVNINQSMMQTLVQISYNIEDTIEYINLTSDSICFDEGTKKFLGPENNDDLPSQLKQLKSLRNMIYSFERDKRIYKIRLYVDGQKMVSTEHVNFFSVESIKERPWYNETLALIGATIWSGVYLETDIANEPDTRIISCRRVIKHSNNIFGNDGILSVDLKESYLYSMLVGVRLRKSESLSVVDSEGRLISGIDKSKLGQIFIEASLLEKVKASGQGILEVGDAGQEKYLVYTTIQENGWIIIDQIDRKNMMEGYSFWGDMQFIILSTLLIMLFVAAAFIIINNITNEIMKRMKLIAVRLEKECVKSEEDQILEHRPNSRDEMGKVENMVYSMIQRSNRLAEESYKVKLEERKAQLMALQAQINPHFLYNTLENINWMAIRRDAPEISSLVTALAKYFRLSLNKGKTVVSIEDEIELIKTYLSIQNIRFDEAFQYTINLAPDIKNYNIPKLTLQPIVENAVLHGIMKMPERVGTITIDTQILEDEILIVIGDDGVGMEQEKIERLLNSQQSEHYGIYNVQERIKLYFGEGYGISIESTLNMGTKVTLHIGKMQNV